MVATVAAESLERLAQEVFEVVRQLALAAPPARRCNGHLRESEFLALSLLYDRGAMVVGEIQRTLGVLPPQMSRIIRSLENRDPGLVACQINPQDKRKIDVRLTEAGAESLRQHRRSRVERIIHVLERLEEHEQESLTAIIDRVRSILRSTDA